MRNMIQMNNAKRYADIVNECEIKIKIYINISDLKLCSIAIAFTLFMIKCVGDV